MAPDTPAAPSAPSPPEIPPLRDKVRLRFRKDRDLRLLSHHDLMRTFERMLRRAELPIRRTQGFHPHPRLVFALSLPLGVVGCAEVVELELDELLPLEEIRDRLMRQAPPGLNVLSIRRIDPRAGAQVRRLCYRLAVPAERAAALRDRIAEVLRATECPAERKRPPARTVDVRPWIADLRLHGAEEDQQLEMELWLTPSGTARPEEVLAALGLHDLFEAGVILERAWLELHDEITPADSSSAGTVSAPTELETTAGSRESAPPADGPAPAGTTSAEGAPAAAPGFDLPPLRGKDGSVRR